jgi:hypothetical protein
MRRNKNICESIIGRRSNITNFILFFVSCGPALIVGEKIVLFVDLVIYKLIV